MLLLPGARPSWSLQKPPTSSLVHRFVHLYKRAAKRIVVSPLGDLIVRPSLAETAVLRGRSSVQSHLLLTYAKSLVAVLTAHAGGLGGSRAQTGVAALVGKKFVSSLLQGSPFLVGNDVLLVLGGETPAMVEVSTADEDENQLGEETVERGGWTREAFNFIRELIGSSFAMRM